MLISVDRPQPLSTEATKPYTARGFIGILKGDAAFGLWASRQGCFWNNKCHNFRTFNSLSMCHSGDSVASNPKLNILLEGLSLLPPRTGVGRSTEYLVRQFCQHPKIEKVHILLSAFPLGKHWRSSLEEIRELGLDVCVHRVPLPYGTLLRSWKRFDRPKIDQWIPEITLIHGPAHVLPSRSSAPGVLTIHDTSVLDHPEWYAPQTRRFGPQIVHGLKKADRVIVPSEAVRRSLIQRYSASQHKISVVPHEIDSNFCPIPIEKKPRIREQILGADFPYIFWSGEINPRKNLPVLFSTLLGLRKLGFSNLRLVLVGSRGYQSKNILQQAEEMGLKVSDRRENSSFSHVDVILLGFVTQEMLWSLYAAADVFLFPSWDEGFGFPVLEAMASGVPVVCSSVGSLPEICENAAVLVNPHDGGEAFAEAVRSVITNKEKYQEYREFGLRRQQMYRSNSMVDRTIQVYEQAISNHYD